MGQLVRSSAANRWPVEPEEWLQTELFVATKAGSPRARVAGELR